MKDILINEYNNTTILNIESKKPQNTFNVNFIDGAFLEISGPVNLEYKTKFIDQKTKKVLHETTLSNNMWTRTNIKYCINWRVEVYQNNNLVYEHNWDPTGKRVYIALDSGALGDTLAWFPYVEEFRKTFMCDVVCSTFHNDWFKENYPNIEFIKPGTVANNLYAMYPIGWFYDGEKVVYDRVPIDFKKYPLQQTASEILGLSYSETKPNLVTPNTKTDIEGEYVVIAPHASAHAKYWMYEKGWQSIIDYLNEKGYKVVMLTGEPLGDEWHDSKLGGTLTGVIDKTGYHIDIKDRMIDIRDAKAFIGVGSGLSWLSWSLNTPTILISGFSYPYTEMQDCERIFPENKSVCTGCFNRHWLNPGDWEWCPDHKDTPRQFECTKKITPDQIIKSINKILKIK
jgi:autotransporter strand-loop-strand O-heptosyltransferase